MSDVDPVSPYLKRRIRTLEEARKDQLLGGAARQLMVRALVEARARGEAPSQQTRHAVKVLLSACPDLDEAVAADAVDCLFGDRPERS